MKMKTCDFCGENPATVKINDPNGCCNDNTDTRTWDVCAECKESISNMQQLAFALFAKQICPELSEIMDQRIIDAKEKLRLEERKGKENK